jgi:hypothetical protein
MKPAAFLLEIVAFIIHDQLDDGALGQIRWFIEYQPTVLDAGSKTTHVVRFTARASTRQADVVTSVRTNLRRCGMAQPRRQSNLLHRDLEVVAFPAVVVQPSEGELQRSALRLGDADIHTIQSDHG